VLHGSEVIPNPVSPVTMAVSSALSRSDRVHSSRIAQWILYDFGENETRRDSGSD